MIRVTVLASIVLIALAGCGEEVFVPANGTIYGNLSYENGEPAAGIEVMVEMLGLTTYSDSDGFFVINQVPAVDETGMGKYYVVRGRGYRDDTSVGFIVTHFKVKGQQSYSIGEVQVPPTGTITGYAFLVGETDHSGVVIHLEETSLAAISRADGSYTLPKVPAHEDYNVVCQRSGYHEMTVADVVVESKRTTQLDPASLEPNP